MLFLTAVHFVVTVALQSHLHQALLSAGNNNGAPAHQSYGSEVKLSADFFSPRETLLFTTVIHLLMMTEQSNCSQPTRHQTLLNLSPNTPGR